MNLTSLDSTAAAGLGRLKALLSISQNRRLLQLETALPSSTLVVERAQWKECVSGHHDAPGPLAPLLATVDCLSTSANLELKSLLGEQITLRLMLPSGAYRTWHGYVAQAAQLGADGGLARYRLQLTAFTHLLALRTDSRVFLGQRADEVISAVLRAYPQANFRLDLSAEALEAAPRRGTITQYRETDAAFVQRLLAEEGWIWRLEHSADDKPLSQAKAAKHCLVISDPLAKRPDLGALRFGKTEVRQSGLLNAGMVEDTITAIAVARHVQPNAVVTAAWDQRRLAGVGAEVRSNLNAGDLPTLEVYEGHGERRFSRHDAADDQAHQPLAERQAALSIARHELRYKSLNGESAVRTLASGANFNLTGHSLYGATSLRSDNQFLVLSIEHEAANNLGSDAAQILRSNDLESGSYSNRFHAVPAAVTLVPLDQVKPRTPGVQTALVVGHDDDALTTERDLRVRVQFAWQRGQAALPGGFDGPLTPEQQATGHAPGNASASQWVRVAQPSAGANWGAIFMPRIGTEVLVDFVEGDIDRPVIIGQLYNGSDALPWPAGVDSGANHPGVLSGWHSRPLDDDGINQWVIDDATGQLRMRLASQSSGSPWSELSLGHIISHGSGSAQRGAWLGSGFYAHTDGWASLRASQGMLLSTTARAGSYGSAQGNQLDVQEATAQLKSAQQLGQALGQAAQAQGALALPSHDAKDTEALHALLDAIDITKNGKHASEQHGATRDANEPVAQFAKPYIVLDTPSAAITVSPASIASYSGQDTTLVAQSDIHATAAHTLSLVSGETTSIYTHEGELQTIAANGKLSLRAHTDQMELLADKEITVISVNDEITITAKERIEMVGGDSKVVLSGGDIEFVTPGAFTVKAASHEWAGGGSGAASLTALPTGQAGKSTHFVELDYRYSDMDPIVGADYKVTFADGSTRTGKLDQRGFARLDGVPNGPYEVTYGEDSRQAFARLDRGSNALAGQSATGDEQADSLIAKYLAQEDEFLKENFFNDEIADMATEVPEYGGTNAPAFEHHYNAYLTEQELKEVAAQQTTYAERHEQVTGEQA